MVVEEVLDSSIDVDERHRVASVDEAGKHEPHLRESGIPSDVLEKLLPGDDVIRLSKPVVAGGFGYRFVKRAFDLVSTGCALVVLAIPMGVVALKIIGGMETQFLAKPVFGAVGA